MTKFKTIKKSVIGMLYDIELQCLNESRSDYSVYDKCQSFQEELSFKCSMNNFFICCCERKSYNF